MSIKKLRADCPKTKDMVVLKQWILKAESTTERLQRLAIVGRKTNPNAIFTNETATH